MAYPTEGGRQGAIHAPRRDGDRIGQPGAAGDPRGPARMTDPASDQPETGAATPQTMGQMFDHFDPQDLSGGTYYGADGAAYATEADAPMRSGTGRALFNVIGGLVSVSLIAGLGVWSYRVVMRDVQGIPIIQAQDGPMRVAPENPGGNIAVHQGLAVNSVQSVGEAVPVPEALVLAPVPEGLRAEDQPRVELAAAMQAEAEAAAQAERLAQAEAAAQSERSAQAQVSRAASVPATLERAGLDTPSPTLPGTTATLASLTPDVIRNDPAAAAREMMLGLTRGVTLPAADAAPREIARAEDAASLIAEPETAMVEDAEASDPAPELDARDSAPVEVLPDAVAEVDDPDVASAIMAALGATQSLEEEVAETVRVAALAQTPEPGMMVKGPGPARSPRPAPRPANRVMRVAPTQVSLPAAPVEAAEVAVADIPVGARLVQLGAFDSAEDARTAWGRINGRFAALMEGKSRVVQEARSGGRTFYRLRATGFDDLSEARRFCAALVAERADCIPVMAR